MTKKLYYALGLSLTAGLASNAGAVVDFESAPDVNAFSVYADDGGLSFNDKYIENGIELQFGYDADGFDTSDATTLGETGGANIFFEAVGSDGTDGFLNDYTSSITPGDTHDTDEDATYDLDSTFIRTSALQNGGSELYQGQVFFIEYTGGADAFVASGEIWDIDGNTSQGTEQWRVTAWCSNLTNLGELLSPIGTTTAPSSLDGEAWKFEFDVRGNTDGPGGTELPIHFITVEFIGSKTDGIGLAFDNFQTAVPEPSTYAAIFGAVALGLAYLRRRKS